MGVEFVFSVYYISVKMGLEFVLKTSKFFSPSFFKDCVIFEYSPGFSMHSSLYSSEPYGQYQRAMFESVGFRIIEPGVVEPHSKGAQSISLSPI